MVDCPNIPILRDLNSIHTKFRWGGEETNLYLLEQMNALTLVNMFLRKKDTNRYAKHDAESSKWLNALLIDSSTNALNNRVNEKFELLPIIE